MGSFEPLVFCARAFKTYDTAFRSTNRSAYSFLKQNEGNPKGNYCSGRSCKYDQHSKKFLNDEKIHFKPHRPVFL